MINLAQRKDHVEDRVVRIEPELPADSTDSVTGEMSGPELAKLWGVTMRALRFYESRGLISPRRNGRVRAYTADDSRRIGLILRAKKLGFTLTEIGGMIDDRQNAEVTGGLQLTAQKCLQQIAHLEAQMKDLIEALADLRRIHLELCRKAGNAIDKAP